MRFEISVHLLPGDGQRFLVMGLVGMTMVPMVALSQFAREVRGGGRERRSCLHHCSTEIKKCDFEKRANYLGMCI